MRHRLMSLSAPLFFLGVFVLGACDARSSDYTQEEVGEIAEQALLRLDDFPTGWVQRSAEEGDDPVLDLPPECEALFENDRRGSTVQVRSPDFYGPDDASVDSKVTVYVDEQTARKPFSVFEDFMERCRDPLVEEYGEALELSLLYAFPISEIEVLELNVDPLSFPQHGDDQAALRLSTTILMDSLLVEQVQDIIAVRVGRLVGTTRYLTTSGRPDETIEERLVRTLEERLGSSARELD